MFVALSEGTRNHLSNQGLSHFCNILDCGEYIGERSERLETAMLFVRCHVRNRMLKIFKGKLWQNEGHLQQTSLKTEDKCFQSTTKTFSI